MLGHQLRQNFILGLDFLLQVVDPFVFGLLVRPSLVLESRGPVLEELFLPPVEYRRLQPELIAEIGDRLLLQ